MALGDDRSSKLTQGVGPLWQTRTLRLGQVKCIPPGPGSGQQVRCLAILVLPVCNSLRPAASHPLSPPSCRAALADCDSRSAAWLSLSTPQSTQNLSWEPTVRQARSTCWGPSRDQSRAGAPDTGSDALSDLGCLPTGFVPPAGADVPAVPGSEPSRREGASQPAKERKGTRATYRGPRNVVWAQRRRHCQPQRPPAHLHSQNPSRDPSDAGRCDAWNTKSTGSFPQKQTGSSPRQELKGTKYIVQHGWASGVVR